MYDGEEELCSSRGCPRDAGTEQCAIALERQYGHVDMGIHGGSSLVPDLVHDTTPARVTLESHTYPRSHIYIVDETNHFNRTSFDRRHESVRSGSVCPRFQPYPFTHFNPYIPISSQDQCMLFICHAVPCVQLYIVAYSPSYRLC